MRCLQLVADVVWCCGLERAAAAVDAALLARFQVAGVDQCAEVPAHGCRRQAQPLCQLSRRGRAVLQDGSGHEFARRSIDGRCSRPVRPRLPRSRSFHNPILSYFS